MITTSSIDGGGWKLVRHVPAGNKWHKAQDQLKGTDMYGKPCGSTCDEEWSVPFHKEKFNQFLFATGDETKWLIADRNVVTGYWYANKPCRIYKSSTSSTSYTAKWYRRKRNFEDPWISLRDHGEAIWSGDIIYGENEYGGIYAENVVSKNNGVNVFIRTKGKSFIN